MTAGQLVSRPTGGTSSTSGSQSSNQVNVQRPMQSGVTLSGASAQRPTQSGGNSGGTSAQRPQSASQQGSSQSGMNTGGQRGSSQSGGGFNLGAPSSLSLGALYDDNEPVRNVANVQYNLNPTESPPLSDEAEDTNRLQQADLNTLTSVPAFEKKQQPENISTRQNPVQPIGYLVVKRKSSLKLGNVMRTKKIAT